jgi:hypothetical protein
MLSGSVPRRMIYGHLGWRRIDDHRAYLHSGGAIGAEGAIEGVEVDTGTDSLLCCQLPPPPEGTALADAVRASLAILELGPDTITAPILGAIYRAPLGEASAIDFALHLAGPTGAFKTELAALAQAHFGAAFNGRQLPASWADTANMLEKKAFLAKDVVLVVDDFARPARPRTSSGCTGKPIACSVPRGTVRAVRGCAPMAAAGRRTIRVA